MFEQCAVCHNVDTDEKKIGPSLKGLVQTDKLKNGKPVNEANVLEHDQQRRQRHAGLRGHAFGGRQSQRNRVPEDA